MIPKYKIGDTVRLYPWSDIDFHSGIPKIYWEDIRTRDLKVLHVQEVEGNIYYNFFSVLFAWNEKFLMPPKFFSDNDFEL